MSTVLILGELTISVYFIAVYSYVATRYLAAYVILYLSIYVFVPYLISIFLHHFINLFIYLLFLYGPDGVCSCHLGRFTSYSFYSLYSIELS